MSLFGGDQNVLHVLPDTHEGACLKVIVAPIPDQVLDRGASPGTELNFVEDDQAFPRVEADIVVGREIEKKRIEVIKVAVEKVCHIF